MAKVIIVVDNENDLKKIDEGKKILEELKIFYDVKIISGMNNLNPVDELVELIEKTEIDVVIVCSGISTHLPGIIASKTIIPVIGVPLPVNDIPSTETIFSIAQMPEGVPVACMSLGKTGIKNAVIFAAQIISRKDENLRKKVKEFKNQYI
ncbi:MAG TPA: AIR carboxylase family protein [bacterium]|nr:AIR carboxylase family protein [bacterium]HOM27359.1 AIR carboxylase family protein [bacterium]